MPKFTDLTSQRFGRLAVVSCVSRSSASSGVAKDSRWLCRCDCGREKVVTRGNLKNGSTRSCGCYRNTQGGLSRKHPLWKRWDRMIQRCTKANDKDYSNYGGRGIRVCRRWISFPLFLEDMERSFFIGATLERKNNNGSYSPANVKWALGKEQSRNRRLLRLIDTKWGRVTVAEAAERAAIPATILYGRLNRGWPAERLFTPKLEGWNRRRKVIPCCPA